MASSCFWFAGGRSFIRRKVFCNSESRMASACLTNAFIVGTAPSECHHTIKSESSSSTDEVGGVEIVVVTPDGGDGSRAFQRGGHTFVGLGQEPGDEGSLFLVDDAEGVWDVTEDGLELRPGAVAQGDVQDPSSLGERLPRLPSRSAFWFGWYAFYPNTQVYGID